MKIIAIDQGTPEWHQWRKGEDLTEGFAITATAAACIAGTSPFKTAYKLWQEMTRRAQPEPVNRFMIAGTRNEPRARELYEAHIKESFSAQCIESEKYPWVRASLDGLTTFQDKTVEIKCPGEKSHLEAVAGIVKPGYRDQMQWQMLATDGSALEGDFVSYFKYPDGREELIVIPVPADLQRQGELLAMAEQFRQCLINDLPPSGNAFEQAAHAWLVLAMQIKALEERADSAKEVLLDLAPTGGQCPGVSVIVTNRKGSTKWQEVAKSLFITTTLTKEEQEALINVCTGDGSSSLTVKATADAELVIAEIYEKSKVSGNISSYNIPMAEADHLEPMNMNW